MKRKINLYWYKHKEGHGNFGDELNPYIIEKLSGQKTNHINIEYLNNNFVLSLKFLVAALFNKKIGFISFVKYLFWNVFGKPKVICAIGSIIQYIKYEKAIIWGSGLISPKYKLQRANYLAVRGKYTQEQIKKEGLPVPVVLGDPALLLPLIYQPNLIKKKYKMGVIPHYSHYSTVEAYRNDSFLLINLLDDIELIIDQINSCDFILSTSLHGLIVSHAYNVPALWVNFHELQTTLFGDDFKFKDYFSSVNLNEYEAINLSIKELSDLQGINEFQEKNIQLLPNKDMIKAIGIDLLKIAPFTILSKYQTYETAD